MSNKTTSFLFRGLMSAFVVLICVCCISDLHIYDSDTKPKEQTETEALVDSIPKRETPNTGAILGAEKEVEKVDKKETVTIGVTFGECNSNSV